MYPVKFKGSNVIFAENQPQYLPLPAKITSEGVVISCWKLTFIERIKILFNGTLFLHQLTFHEPLQPQRPDVNMLEYL